jgi:hypothetical protein
MLFIGMTLIMKFSVLLAVETELRQYFFLFQTSPKVTPQGGGSVVCHFDAVIGTYPSRGLLVVTLDSLLVGYHCFGGSCCCRLQESSTHFEALHYLSPVLYYFISHKCQFLPQLVVVKLPNLVYLFRMRNQV